MRQINVSKQAEKFIKRLPPKQRRQVSERILDLALEAHPSDARPLIGTVLMRIDVGEYRAVYSIQGNSVEVVVVGKRNDDAVYKKLERKLR